MTRRAMRLQRRQRLLTVVALGGAAVVLALGFIIWAELLPNV